MKIKTDSIRVIREGRYGDEEPCIKLAAIREPEFYTVGSDGLCKPKFPEEASQMRTKMVLRYLRDDIVVDIPKSLVTEVRDELFRYAEKHPKRGTATHTAIMSDVCGSHYDLNTRKGRIRQLRLYLEAYMLLRSYERNSAMYVIVN